jgi:hypothetical protein
MTSSLLLAAAAGPAEAAVAIDFPTALLLVLVVCLAFIAKALADLSRRVSDLAATRAITAATRGASGTNGRCSSDAPPPAEVLAVIAAAVHTALDQPARIVAVDEVKGAPNGVWSLEGRRQIFSSHRVR